jgi:hypothetical protein
VFDPSVSGVFDHSVSGVFILRYQMCLSFGSWFVDPSVSGVFDPSVSGVFDHSVSGVLILRVLLPENYLRKRRLRKQNARNLPQTGKVDIYQRGFDICCVQFCFLLPQSVAYQIERNAHRNVAMHK